jgi:type I restriction enzyme, S subunit
MKRETDFPLARWVTDLPSDWNVIRQGNVAEILFSNVDKHTYDEEVSVLLCNYTDVYYNDQITSKIEFMEASAEEREIKKFQLLKGDVLITKDSETPDDIAISAVVAEELPGVLCGYHIALVRPYSHKVSGRYLAWVHASKQLRAQYEANAVGVTRFGLAQHIFKEVLVPLPPFPEQERIAAYLDKSCAAIDAAVQAKQSQIETLDELRKTAILTAFTELDKYPTGRVKDLTTKIGSGVTPDGGAANYLDSGIPLLRSQNVHFDGLYLDDVAYISEETHESMSNSQLQPKDVLLNITGASIGRCTFVPENFGEGNVNQHVCIVRPTPKIDHCYLAAFLSSPFGQDQILSSFTGASRQGLSQKELGLIRLPLPPHEVQEQVVSKIEQSNEMYKDVRDCLEKQIDILVEYRKSLIHECVTGQRRVTEADLKQV